MIRRFLQPRILAALADTPILLLVGARQAGKTTLARALIEEGAHDARYLTLDAPAVLEAATGDPAGFVRGLEGPVILDEVQRAPELFLPIKQAVDSKRVPGSFLLTGSANVLLQPALSDALVGRLEALTLWPLAAAEIESSKVFAMEFMARHDIPTAGFEVFDAARAATSAELEALTRSLAAEAGAAEVNVTLATAIRDATIEGKKILGEATVTATATGRPRLAEPEAETSLPRGFAGV